jgi:hypothetical protein
MADACRGQTDRSRSFTREQLDQVREMLRTGTSIGAIWDHRSNRTLTIAVRTAGKGKMGVLMFDGRGHHVDNIVTDALYD